MLIDWFTVGAQALNFALLVLLLTRFLYKPILRAIDAREKRIAAELSEAAAKKAEAEHERDELHRKNEEIDQQRATLLRQATSEAKVERTRLLDDARRAADALGAKRDEALRSEARELHRAISRRTQAEVFAIARKALMDLATTSLEERMGAVFNRRLRDLGGSAKERLGAALKSAAAPALVRSAFELPAKERATIQNAVNETFSADIHLRFEVAPETVSGIELATDGQRVGWSIAEYLTAMEKSVGELLNEKDRAETTGARHADPEPKPATIAMPRAEAPRSETKSA